MTRRIGLAGICIIALALLAVAPARAELKLPAVFSDHAVLQAGTELPVWGWADAGQSVELSISGKAASATAGADGKWMVKLPAMTASAAPVEMKIKAGEQTKTIADVLVGEVWMGSGQSNMTRAMSMTDNARDAIAQATEPTIRLFTVPRTAATQPAANVEGHWEVCSPATVPTFSAVLYHFGRNLHDALKTPVGLIHSSWGGTPIQAWMPREAFAGGDEQIAAQRKHIMARYPVSTTPATNQAPRNVHLEPTRLFNGMIYPLAPYAIRGVTWYQGENNIHQGDVSDYAAMMTAMVGSWRKLWGEDGGPGDWAFLYVQIAPYGKYPPTGNNLPEMWEQQTRALTMIPNSGMAAISDLGDPADIHPKNKREVGRRLALIALAKTYKQLGIACDAPMLESARREEKKIRVHFSGASDGLISRDGKPLAFFEIAGTRGDFVPATAAIEGADVLVESADITEPAMVRFGWSAIAAPNLVNKSGLPAVAFRVEAR